MSKMLKQIFKGWKYYLKSEYNMSDTSELEVIAKERLKTCHSCDYMIKTKNKLVRIIEMALVVPNNSCGICKCNVYAKSFLMDAECPVGKWKKQDGSIDSKNT